jgi:hypothetical protein
MAVPAATGSALVPPNALRSGEKFHARLTGQVLNLSSEYSAASGIEVGHQQPVEVFEEPSDVRMMRLGATSSFSHAGNLDDWREHADQSWACLAEELATFADEVGLMYDAWAVVSPEPDVSVSSVQS